MADKRNPAAGAAGAGGASMSSAAMPVDGALRERLALDGLDYPIAPSANRLAYMLGGLTFFGILLMIVTGILLDQFYNSDPAGGAAHDSIIYIMTRVPLGSWV